MFAIEAVDQLFASYGSGSALEVSEAVCDLPGLEVRGRALLAGQARATCLRFLTDLAGEAVVGVEAVAEGFDWLITEPPEAAGDFTFLCDVGFTEPVALFSAGHEVTGVVCADGSAYAVGPGAGFTVPTGDGPATAYVTVLAPGVLQRYQLSARLPNAVPLASVEALAELPFLKGLPLADLDIPAQIENALSAVSLREVSAAYATDTSSIDQAGVVLTVVPGTRWEIIEGFLALESFQDLILTAVLEDGSWQLAASMGATFTVAGRYELRADLALPQQRLTATLAQPDRGADLIADHLDGSGLDLSSVTVDCLRVECDIPTRSYCLALALATDTPWTPIAGVALEGLELRLRGQGSSAIIDATLTGRFTIGQSTVVLEGVRSGTVWRVAGSAFGVDVDSFATWFHSTFRVELPDAVAGLNLSEIALSFSSDGTGVVTCSGWLPLGDGAVDSTFCLRAELSRTGGAWSPRFEAELEIRADLGGEDGPYPMRFTVTLGSDPAGKQLTARWEATDRPVPLFAVLRSLGLADLGDIEETLPATLRPDLSELTLVYDSVPGCTVVVASTGKVSLVVASVRDGQGTSTWAAQVSVAVRASLSELPLLNGLIPSGEDLGLTGVRVVSSSRSVPRVLLGRLNQALAEASPSSPALPVLDGEQGGLPGGTWLALEYVVPGSVPGLLTVQLGGSRPAFPVSQALPVRPAGRRVLEGVVLAPGQEPLLPEAEGRAGAWVELGRSFGPLAVHRVGVRYEAGTIWLMVDGALSAAGFTMAVQGLALGVDLGSDAFVVRSRLEGLAVEFDRPPLRIAGALINRPPESPYVLMVGGMLVVQLPRLGITAVGAYQRRDDGMPSLFVFGRAVAALGGPPPFRVTGLAAGFGFNSSLRIPEFDEVTSFPLVKGLSGGLPENPMDVLDSLTGTWVKPRQGQIWLAAGLDFTSFEFITGRLLLLLEAGNDLTVALLGTARAAFPKTGKAYAQVALQLRIVYQSARGEFAATALLYDSYVIDPSCVLSGGFAFFMWSGVSDHAGDFALTAGGYHPEYTAPAHYPQVPRLEFTWSLGAVSISGTAFFALTPSAVMAGGTLDVRYSSGPLKAWLSAYALLLIRWKPFHFRVGIGISIGASLNVLFGTVRGELSASLDLWGPPTGGKVTAKFTFVKVTVKFGPGDTSSQDRLTWPQFTELLPPTEQVLRIGASAGLLADAEPPQGRDVSDPNAPWLVDAGGFTFVAETSVPASEAIFQEEERHSGSALDIRPMGESGKRSSFTVQVARNTAQRGVAPRWEALENDGSWQATPILDAVPTSLWGAPNADKGDLLDPARRLLTGRCTGLKVVVPPPVTTGRPLGEIAEASLAYEEMPDAAGPLKPTDRPTGDLLSLATGTGVGTVAENIASGQTVSARTRLAGALAGLLDPLPDDSLRAFADHATTDGLPADPLLREDAAARGEQRPRPVASA
ncbi:DUF6603 domain-containing protein [Kitasatospora sp. NPDC052896]|uniref:DUF6603 domain-containing protein n=1 Tax=Kitasatospora sp. NPDC052896 TaxID=3364061 RepID=UPI0037C68BEA